ncbi:hypothetical protein AZF01_15650 [Martelella sp. AD-3]|nr:hypothetical protein AZF01_15650 [Martelella sp. AD-3]
MRDKNSKRLIVDRERVLKALSKIEGGRQAQADLLGVTPSSISQWFAGETVPVADRCYRLADALNLPASIFFRDFPLDEFDEALSHSVRVNAKTAASRIVGGLLRIEGRFDLDSQRHLSRFTGNYWLFRRSIANPSAKVAKSAFVIFKSDQAFRFEESRRLFGAKGSNLGSMRMEGGVAITDQRELVFSGYTFVGSNKKPKYMISNEYTEDYNCFSVLLTAPSMRNDPAFSCECILIRTDDQYQQMLLDAQVVEIDQANAELETYNRQLPSQDSFVVLRG